MRAESVRSRRPRGRVDREQDWRARWRLRDWSFALTAPAAAQSAADYPNKPIRIVVSVPAGGGVDLSARIIANHLQHAVGPAGDGREPHRRQRQHRRRSGVARGAGRLHAAGDAAQHRSPPTPRCSGSSATTRRRSTPVAIMAVGANVLAVKKDSPAKTASDLIAHAKANAGKLSYASQGNGSTSPPHVGAVQEPHRRPGHARALQRRGARRERSRRRACRHDVLRSSARSCRCTAPTASASSPPRPRSGSRCLPDIADHRRERPVPASTRRRSSR